MVKHHGEFQRYYFGHHLGEDRDVRERHRGHQWFELTEEFCEEYDQRAFDPDYPTRTLEHYEPLVRSLISLRVATRRSDCVAPAGRLEATVSRPGGRGPGRVRDRVEEGRGSTGQGAG